MAAPKGNQFNRGNPSGRAGRLREQFSHEEVEELGNEMLDWVKNNNPLHLSQWYSGVKMLTYNEWKLLIQYKDFLPYYQNALHLVGLNYINGTINSSIAQRFIRVYFKDVKEEENETEIFKSELKKKENESVSKNLNDIAKELTEAVRNNYKNKND